MQATDAGDSNERGGTMASVREQDLGHPDSGCVQRGTNKKREDRSMKDLKIWRLGDLVN